MTPVRMTHPVHGATHVYDEIELKEREAKGWTVEIPAEVLEPKKRGRPRKEA